MATNTYTPFADLTLRAESNGQLRTVALLGATGSIGESTLAVLREHRERLKLTAIACGSNVEQLASIAREFKVQHVAFGDEAACRRAQQSGMFLDATQFFAGQQGLSEWAESAPADILVSAASGTVGLLPTMAAIHSSKDIALASKEILVIAGKFVTEAVKVRGVKLLPVDSEHSAILQCSDLNDAKEINRIILTASGGPFRDFTTQQMQTVTPQQALQHPTWCMGEKITIDCATMANKGLELIEAHWLFNIPADKLQVVVHPQSIVHSFVEFVDGSTLAQLSPPSMTLPIQYALLYPKRLPGPQQALNFNEARQLDFYPPDMERFPCLSLAREALSAGGMATAIYNAANEVAVQAFRQQRLPFMGIPQVIQHCLQKISNQQPVLLQDALAKENEVRRLASEALKLFV